MIVFKGNRKMLEDVLEGLFHIAKADAALHPHEEEFLGQVAKRFGLSDSEFDTIKARHVACRQARSLRGAWLDALGQRCGAGAAVTARCLPRTVPTS